MMKTDESEEENEEAVSKKRKIMVHPIYIVHHVCKNRQEALECIKEEDQWNNYCMSHETKGGTKEYYGCKRKGCSKRIGLWYDNIDETVRIAIASNIFHLHDEEEVVFGMDSNTKKAIDHVFIMGTKTALSIKYALRNPLVLSQLPVTIKKEVLIEYTQKQIENYLFQTLKPRLLLKSSFNYG